MIQTVAISIDEFEGLLKADRVVKTISYIHKVHSHKRGRKLEHYQDYLEKGEVATLLNEIEMSRAEELQLIEKELKKIEE